jgi:hypothetical protein
MQEEDVGPSDALRKYAAYCVGKAQAVQSDAEKAAWLAMAQAWLRLAQDAAQLRKSAWVPASAVGER